MVSNHSGLIINISWCSSGSFFSEKALKEFKSGSLRHIICRGRIARVCGDWTKRSDSSVLEKCELETTIHDLGWIELNKAFAAQVLAVARELDFDMQKVNPWGGAIALGHPLGAAGAIRTATMMNGLNKTQGKYGMVTMCIGTGMGFAMIVENLR